MEDLCSNFLIIEAPNQEDEHQLHSLLQKSKVYNEAFAVEGWKPCRSEIDYVIYRDSTIGAGIVLWYKRNAEEITHKDLIDIENFLYGEYKDHCENLLSREIDKPYKFTVKDFENFLLTTGQADLENGYKAYTFFKESGIIDRYDWAQKCWGTMYSANSTIMLSMPQKAIIKFITKDNPPRTWLKTVSNDLPGLNFQLQWYLGPSKNGIITATKGAIKEG
ncbi:MAG TPA: hypothetical protein VFF33_14070 [Ignavibacteriaceae bacterium]|nr:hypothetical protein [Ignavibacteriaceae bacterium]